MSLGIVKVSTAFTGDEILTAVRALDGRVREVDYTTGPQGYFKLVLDCEHFSDNN